MSTKYKSRCATEGCHKYCQQGYPYCSACLTGLLESVQGTENAEPAEMRLPGFEARQWARRRHTLAQECTMRPDVGFLEWTLRKLKGAA